jgi:hypothetical protein
MTSFGGATLLAEELDGALGREIKGSKTHAFFLTAGGVGAGVSFHHHNQGLNLLLSGTKRWFLYPPTTLPKPSFPDTHIAIKDWVANLLPTLSAEARPLEVTQNDQLAF